MFPLFLLVQGDVWMFDLYVCFYASSINSVFRLKNVCQTKQDTRNSYEGPKTAVGFRRRLKCDSFC